MYSQIEPQVEQEKELGNQTKKTKSAYTFILSKIRSSEKRATRRTAGNFGGQITGEPIHALSSEEEPELISFDLKSPPTDIPGQENRTNPTREPKKAGKVNVNEGLQVFHHGRTRFSYIKTSPNIGYLVLGMVGEFFVCEPGIVCNHADIGLTRYDSDSESKEDTNVMDELAMIKRLGSWQSSNTCSVSGSDDSKSSSTEGDGNSNSIVSGDDDKLANLGPHAIEKGKMKQKLVVSFASPPVTSLRQYPRHNMKDLPCLFFSEAELKQMDTDRQSTYVADQVECVIVAEDGAASGKKNMFQLFRLNQTSGSKEQAAETASTSATVEKTGNRTTVRAQALRKNKKSGERVQLWFREPLSSVESDISQVTPLGKPFL